MGPDRPHDRAARGYSRSSRAGLADQVNTQLQHSATVARPPGTEVQQRAAQLAEFFNVSVKNEEVSPSATTIGDQFPNRADERLQGGFGQARTEPGDRER